MWQQWSCCAPYVWLSSADTGYELADWAEFNPSLFADILSNIMSGQFVAITRRGFRIYSFKTSFSVLSPLKDWDNFIVVFGRTNCAKSLLCLINFTALCITLCIVLRPQLELGDLVLICFSFFANCSFFPLRWNAQNPQNKHKSWNSYSQFNFCIILLAPFLVRKDLLIVPSQLLEYQTDMQRCISPQVLT